MRILKSMPMVVMKEGVKESSEKRNSKQDFPTPSNSVGHNRKGLPLSPMRRSLIR